MSTFERGPLLTYEVTWQSGHIETIQAHQVILPPTFSLFGEPESKGPRRIMFHGEIDGHWQLVLAADEDDIKTIRNVTTTEVLG